MNYNMPKIKDLPTSKSHKTNGVPVIEKFRLIQAVHHFFEFYANNSENSNQSNAHKGELQNEPKPLSSGKLWSVDFKW